MAIPLEPLSIVCSFIELNRFGGLDKAFFVTIDQTFVANKLSPGIALILSKSIKRLPEFWNFG